MKSLLGTLAGEIVPALLGLVIGLWLLAFAAWPLALAGFLAGWTTVSFLLRRCVRPQPRRRLVWRVALTLWATAWTLVALSVRRHEPGPPSPPETIDWTRPHEIASGTADVAFELPEQTTLAGWGHRPRRLRMPPFAGLGPLGRLSLGRTRPIFRRPERPGQRLGARAVVVLPRDAEPGGAPPVAFVRLDLIESTTEITEAVLARVADLGFTAATLLVAATHTHSGPGGFLRAPLAWIAGADHFDAAVEDAIVDAATEAIRRAVATAEPARLAFADSRDRGTDDRPLLARNRRQNPDDIDDRVFALRLESADDGRLLAVVLNYAVHPVYLEPEHMAWDRDIAGVVEERLTTRLPGRPPVLFVNGAEGDINFQGKRRERTMEEIVGPFVERIADDLLATPSFERLHLKAGRVTRDLGSSHAWAAVGSGEAFVDDVVPSRLGQTVPQVTANVLSLPMNVPLWSLGLTELRLGFSFRGAFGLTLDLERLLTRRRFAFGVLVLAASGEASGGAGRTILWCPCEANSAVGQRWRRQTVATGLPGPTLFGLTNGALAYVATPEEYPSGSYEAQNTLFGRHTADLIEESLLASSPREEDDDAR